MRERRFAYPGIALFLIGWLSSQVSAEIVNRVAVAEGLASHPVNGGRCLVSDGRFQFLAFYDGDHCLTVAKRRLGESDWEFAKLPEKVGWDTHNKITIFLDREGQLHLTGNMHGAPLCYYRTKTAGDIQSFEGVHTWAGVYEERVTYPNLLQMRDGSSHMMYRHGGSGNGMRLLVHYSEETRKWTGTGRSFISGMDRKPTCNAYPFGGLHEDVAGTIHVAWCWRETPDVETNFDIAYAKSTDGGRTWTAWDGRELELPIHPENADVADRIPQRNGLMNGGTVVIDPEGVPYIGYTRYGPEGNNQIFVATPQGERWRAVQVTDWKTRFWFEGRGTIPKYPPIPRLSFAADGKLEIRYSHAELKPRRGRILLSREELLSMKPGEYTLAPREKTKTTVPNARAVNIGPLPNGETHTMQQAVAPPNRDRRPENPRPPTTITIVETRPGK